MSVDPYSDNTPPAYSGGSSVRPEGDDVMWAVVAHLSALIAALVSAGFLGWLIPLVIYIVFRDRSAFVRQASAGAFNFALTIFVLSMVAGILVGIGLLLGVLILPLILVLLGGVLWIAIAVAVIVIPLIAVSRANRGEIYQYPWTITVLR